MDTLKFTSKRQNDFNISHYIFVLCKNSLKIRFLEHFFSEIIDCKSFN